MLPPAHTYPRGIDCNRCFTFASVTSRTMCLFTLPHHQIQTHVQHTLYVARETHLTNKGVTEPNKVAPMMLIWITFRAH